MLCVFLCHEVPPFSDDKCFLRHLCHGQGWSDRLTVWQKCCTVEKRASDGRNGEPRKEVKDDTRWQHWTSCFLNFLVFLSSNLPSYFCKSATTMNREDQTEEEANPEKRQRRIEDEKSKKFGNTICVLILVYMCPHTVMICVVILLCMCPHTDMYVSSYYYIRVFILLYISSYYYICVLILLYMFPYIPIHMSSYYHIFVFIFLAVRLHTTVFVRIILYMCLHTTMYMSSYSCTCVLKLLYVSSY